MKEYGEVFISYHKESAEDIVKKVSVELEREGINCWYAQRNASGSYSENIVRAIRYCKIFLLILDKGSNESAHVLSEISYAFERFNNHEDIELLIFKIEQCDLSDGVHYYLGSQHIIDAYFLSEAQKINELTIRISKQLGKRHQKTGKLKNKLLNAMRPEEEKIYRIVHSMVYPNINFVGREEELFTIKEYLSGIPNKIFLIGMGGIGKSEIVKMYLKRNADLYDVVLWVPFKGSIKNTVISDYAFPIQGISRTDYIEDSDYDYFLKKMRVLKEIADSKVIIVIDNFDVQDDPDLTFFCSGRYNVLFTTRYSQKNQTIPSIIIEKIKNEDELIKLFYTKYHRGINKNEEKIINDIIHQLDNHTLSIPLVATTMQSKRISPEKMLQLLKCGISEIREQKADAADLIFEHLKKLFQLSDLSKRESCILRNLALFSVHGISVELLYNWMEIEDFEVIDLLINKSWIIYNSVTDEVHLHPLIAKLMMEGFSAYSDDCKKLVENMLAECKQSTTDCVGKRIQLYEYAGIIYQYLPEKNHLKKMALEAKVYMLQEMSLYHECIDIYEKLIEEEYDVENKINLYNRLCRSYVFEGNAGKGIKVALEGRKIFERLSLNEITERMGYYYNILLSRLSEAYRCIGDLENAVKCGLHALEICDDYLVDVSMQSKRGWLEYHLSYAYYDMSNLQKAEYYIKDAIELFEEVEDFYGLCYSYDILSQILMKQRRFDKALKLNENARQILQTFHNYNHFDTAKNFERRGKIYHEMNEDEKAEEYYKQAIAIYQQLNANNQVKLLKERRVGGKAI